MFEMLLIGSLCHAQRFLELWDGKHFKYMAEGCFDVCGNDFDERSMIFRRGFIRKGFCLNNYEIGHKIY